MKKLLIVLFFWGVGGGIGSHAQSLLPLDPAVRTGRLANGLTYYIRRNTEPKDRVVLYLVNKVGSILESDRQQGLAHFMEHMSFNGTAHFPKDRLIDYLQRSGVRFGADINAFTSFDETVYQLPIPSDRPELLNNGMLILRDWAQDATLDSTEIDKERGVVLEEKRLGKGAGERMQRIYWPRLLNHSRYAVRLPIGQDEVLEHFKPAEIRRFYRDWYRPDLQAVVVVGDIDVDQMEQVVKKGFADLKNPVGERKRAEYKIPLTGKQQFIAVTDREMSATEAEVLIKHPKVPLRTAADYRQYILQRLFNQMMEQRYGELLRQADPPFLNASAGINAFMGGLDVYDASVTVASGLLERGFKAMWREVIRAQRYGFTRTELDRAKNNYISSMDAAWKEKDKTASVSYANEYQNYFLQGIAAPGIDVEYALVKKNMPGITLAEINRLAGKYITAADRDILLLAPDKDRAGLPDSMRVAAWLREVEKEPLTQYREEGYKMSFLTTPPVAGHITGEQRDRELGLTTLTLSNGVKVLLKPTDFRNEEVLFSASAPGGSSLYSDEDFPSASNAAGIISAGGAGNYDVTQLQRYLTGKQLEVQPYIGERSQGFSGAARSADLESALELLYAYFTEPRKDTAIFRSIISRTRASLVNRNNDPGAVFSDTVSAVLGGYSVRRTGPSVEKMDRIDLDKAYRIYKERFSDAAAFTFTFVGNFDTAAIRPLLEKLLGALPAIHKKEAAKDLGISIPKGVISRTVYKGSENKAMVYLVFSGDLEYNQENRVRLDALKETLEIRLLQRLREEESGVYSPRVQMNVNNYPKPVFTFIVSFGCAPANADKLVASTLDEMGKLRKEGPLQVNIDKWKAEDRTARETQLRTNGWWLGYLNRQLENGEDLHQLDGHAAVRDGTTVEKLKEAANRYLDGTNFIRLQWLPAEK